MSDEEKKPQEESEQEKEDEKKPEYGTGYIPNPWSEWEKKAYRKGLMHE